MNKYFVEIAVAVLDCGLVSATQSVDLFVASGAF